MKIDSKPGNLFRPVHITITLETQDELDRFASLMNYTPVNEFLGGNEELYEVPRQNGANPHKYIGQLKNMKPKE